MFEKCKIRKLEKRRTGTLSTIAWDRLEFEEMVQRARGAGDSLDETFVNDVVKQFNDIDQKAKQETDAA